MDANSSAILLVDDDENDVFLLRHALQRSGLKHRLFHVFDGQQCIRYLNRQPPFEDAARFPMPNLVLLDLKMPVTDGLQVLTWLQTQPHLKSLPVAVLSGSDRRQDIESSHALGAAEYHVKPADLNSLTAILKALDARWLAPNTGTRLDSHSSNSH